MKVLWLIIAGTIGGIVGGMGMGGGTLLIPILTIFLSVNQHAAQAINLISFIPMSIICLIIHSKNGLLNIKDSWLVALISCVGAVTGALISSYIKAIVLSKCLGAFLILLAILQFILIFVKKNKNS